MLFDIATPSNPRLIGESSLAGYVRGVYIDDSLLFVATDFNGLRVLNIQDLTDINEVGSYITNGWSSATFYNEGYIYMIDIDCGFWILEHDCDEDELFSRTEFELGTPPNNPDADSDNLTDGAEVNYYFTDPLNSDSDSDLMPDGWEVQYGLNPLFNDSQQDDDTDELSALDEYLAGTSPLTNDTDSDGLSDSAELRIYGTSPILSDTDSDQMPDGWEVQYSLNPLFDDSHLDPDMDDLNNLLEYRIGTSPILADSDADGYLDSWEYYNGFDPMDPNVGFIQYFVSILGWLGLGAVAIMGAIAIHWISKKYTDSGTHEGYPYDGTYSRKNRHCLLI